jgi:transcriptional regulator with XRE-family HTH domain
LGVVSDYLLKLVRETIGATESDLAEELTVDGTTVQEWESGRRPLTALLAADLIRLRMRLIRLGAPPAIFDALGDALKADMIIAQAIEAGDSVTAQDDHLLASFVHKRDLTNMVTWPFTGLTPPRLRYLNRHCASPQDPVSNQPVFGEEERARFFDHLLFTADAYRRDENALLRRQAIYLLGFDI